MKESDWYVLLLKRILELNPPMQPESPDIPARLLPLPGVKVVLFDIYGTLLSCGYGEVGAGITDSADPAQQALISAGFHPSDARTGERAGEFLKYWIKKEHLSKQRDGIEYPEVDIREIWERVLQDLKTEHLISTTQNSSAMSQRHMIEQLAIEYESRVNPAWPMPGLKETLDELVNRGFKLGVVSNAQFYTPLIFKALAGTAWNAFDPQLCVLSYELLEAKPSTRLFKRALEYLAGQYGYLPSETLFIGNDMLNDMFPAALVGCKTALFAGDKKSLRLRNEERKCAGLAPRIVISSLTQLPDLI